MDGDQSRDDGKDSPPQGGSDHPVTPVVKTLLARIAQGMGWASLGRIVLMISTVFVAGLATRLLPPSEAGAYFLGLSIATSLGTVAEFGLGRAAVRLIAESLAREMPGTARAAIHLVWRLGAITIVGVGLLIASPLGEWLTDKVFDSVQLTEVLWLVALLAALRACGQIRAEIFRGFNKIGFASTFKGVDANLVAAGILGLVYLTIPQFGTLKTVLGITCLAWVPGLLAGMYLIRRRTAALLGPSDTTGREVLGIAWPIMLTGLGALLLGQGDLWIVGATLSEDDVALYGAALRLVVLVGVPLTIVNSVVPPIIAELNVKSQKDRLQEVLQATAGGATAGAALLLAIFLLGGDTVLGIAFGPYYEDGATILVILALGHFLNVAFGSCTFVLTMTGNEKKSMAITASSAVVMLAFAPLLGTFYGGPGVAAAATVGLTMRNIASWMMAKKLTGLWTHASPRPLLRASKRLLSAIHRR